MKPRRDQPALTAFILGQLRALSDEARALERTASGLGGGTATAETMDRLRHRVAAHVLVEERLLVPCLRGSRAYREWLRYEGEHDALEHWAAEIQASGCPAPEVAALGRVLCAHIEEESRVVRSAAAEARDQLGEIPPWRAAELFECAGGPTDTWPGEWLG